MLLEIEHLSVSLSGAGPVRRIVDDVSFVIEPQQIVALVGGSGSGKTTTGLSMLRLLSPALNIGQGRILFEGRDLLACGENEMRAVRGKEISMVFQEPLDAFNPVFPVGSQIEEVLIYHTSLNTRQRRERVLDLMDRVGIKDSQRVAGSYPHQLSGGMRQRAMIAQAIAAGPKLIIADEPTSNLDVTLQARMIGLFKTLRETLRTSILLITHDLGVVGHMADHVVVMKGGAVVEQGPTQTVMQSPGHEYTRELLEALG